MVAEPLAVAGDVPPHPERFPGPRINRDAIAKPLERQHLLANRSGRADRVVRVGGQLNLGHAARQVRQLEAESSASKRVGVGLIQIATPKEPGCAVVGCSQGVDGQDSLTAHHKQQVTANAHSHQPGIQEEMPLAGQLRQGQLPLSASQAVASDQFGKGGLVQLDSDVGKERGPAPVKQERGLAVGRLGRRLRHTLRHDDFAHRPRRARFESIPYRVIGRQGFDQLSSRLAVATAHVGEFSVESGIADRRITRALRPAEHVGQFGHRAGTNLDLAGPLLAREQQLRPQQFPRIEELPDQMPTGLLGDRLGAEVLQKALDGLGGLLGDGGLQAPSRNLVDLGLNVRGRGFTERGQSDLNPTVATHRKRLVDRLHLAMVAVQLDQLQVVFQCRAELTRPGQPHRHQSQIRRPLFGPVYKLPDLVDVVPPCGELLAKAVEEGVAEQFAGIGVRLAFLCQRASKTPDGLLKLAFVPKDLASQGQRLGVVAGRGQPLVHLFSQGLQLVVGLQARGVLGYDSPLVADQIAGHDPLT